MQEIPRKYRPKTTLPGGVEEKGTMESALQQLYCV